MLTNEPMLYNSSQLTNDRVFFYCCTSKATNSDRQPTCHRYWNSRYTADMQSTLVVASLADCSTIRDHKCSVLLFVGCSSCLEQPSATSQDTLEPSQRRAIMLHVFASALQEFNRVITNRLEYFVTYHTNFQVDLSNRPRSDLYILIESTYATLYLTPIAIYLPHLSSFVRY